MLWELHSKVASLEAKRFQKQSVKGSEMTPRRSARESKGKRRAELRALTSELTRRFDVIESEQGGESARQERGGDTSAESIGTGGHKCGRMEAAKDLDPSEGTSYGFDPYDEPMACTQGTVEASRNGKKGEYDAAHNTTSPGVSWPWFNGPQQSICSSNMGFPLPMAWPGGFWPPVAQQWFGWGIPGTGPDKTGPSKECKDLEMPRHLSVPNTGYNSFQTSIPALGGAEFHLPSAAHRVRDGGFVVGRLPAFCGGNWLSHPCSAGLGPVASWLPPPLPTSATWLKGKRRLLSRSCFWGPFRPAFLHSGEPNFICFPQLTE